MTALTPNQADYALVHADIVALLESAHRSAQRQRTDDRQLLGDRQTHR